MNSRAFTIIELVIALFILGVAVFGSYAAFSRMIVMTTGLSSRLTAAYLAQEGLEIVRNMRDNNWISEAAWNNALNVCELTGCEADYKTGTALEGETTPLRSYSDTFLNIDENGCYSYGPGSGTRFKRKITITPEPGKDYVFKMSSQILWNEKGEDFEFTAEEYLYNWY